MLSVRFGPQIGVQRPAVELTRQGKPHNGSSSGVAAAKPTEAGDSLIAHK